MRLIDADKLKEELKVNGLGYQYYMLDNTPTVKAIPIEYIKAFKEEVRDVANGKAVIERLLEDWGKENGE